MRTKIEDKPSVILIWLLNVEFYPPKRSSLFEKIRDFEQKNTNQLNSKELMSSPFSTNEIKGKFHRNWWNSPGLMKLVKFHRNSSFSILIEHWRSKCCKAVKVQFVRVLKGSALIVSPFADFPVISTPGGSGRRRGTTAIWMKTSVTPRKTMMRHSKRRLLGRR